jgi:thiol-disulfide isomerase/thioredoxin
MNAARILALLLILVLAELYAVQAAVPEALEPIEGKVVWVDFWASWCAPCRRSFPWMNSMHRKYGPQGLQIIGVNVDKERRLADEFLEESPAEFELRFDPAGELAEQFDVQAMPSSYLLDASGNVLERHFGFKLADAEEYERAIRAALAGSAPNQEIALE